MLFRSVAKLAKERFDFIELVETVAGRLLLDTPETNYVFHYELPEDKVFIHMWISPCV